MGGVVGTRLCSWLPEVPGVEGGGRGFTGARLCSWLLELLDIEGGDGRFTGVRLACCVLLLSMRLAAGMLHVDCSPIDAATPCAADVVSSITKDSVIHH